jgi:glycosyltransferase involved in cell wall biosynthesis
LVERITFFCKVKKYANQIQPDIVETYDWSAPLIFKLKGVKTVIRLHGSNTANNLYMQKNRSVLLSNLEKMAILKADFILSVSNHIAELTRKSFGLNFTSKTIYNGVDTSLFNDYGIERNNNKILFVGRMHPYKGLEDLFAALNLVFTENKSVYFEIVCTVIEDYKAKLLSLVDKEFHPRIKFTGRVNNDELPTYYNSANLSILPSRAEAFPIIPLESMACGTPVIIADRFSAREIVEDNEDGFLVNALDKTELANKILHILENQSIIEEMRKKTRQKIVDNFSIDKVLQDNIDFYQTISGVK